MILPKAPTHASARKLRMCVCKVLKIVWVILNRKNSFEWNCVVQRTGSKGVIIIKRAYAKTTGLSVEPRIPLNAYEQELWSVIDCFRL